MEIALQRMGEMIEAAATALRAWFAAGGEAVDVSDPRTWPALMWWLLAAFFALLIAAFARRRSRAPLDVRAPEILITQGELVPEPRTGRMGAGLLTMTVSNLGRYPVQLLEAASRGGGGRVGVAEVVTLVPAMSEVEVELQLPIGKLEDGVLEVYCYAAATRVKTWRHRAELVWEPWAKRFKVAPLEQRIDPVKALASARRDVVRMDDVRKAAEVVAQQAATVASHVEAKRSEITPRPVEAKTPRRAWPTETTDVQAPTPPTGQAKAPSNTSEGRPLAALLGRRQASIVTPPPAPNGGGAGASARATRGAGPAEAASTPAPVTMRPPSSAAKTPAAPLRPVPPRPATVQARPAPAAGSPGTDAATDDPDAPTVPKRPPGRTLEFPDEF